jgi:hypothetical protein
MYSQEEELMSMSTSSSSSSSSSALAVIQAGAKGNIVSAARSGGGGGAISARKLIELSDGFASYTAATANVDWEGAGQTAAATEFAKILLDVRGQPYKIFWWMKQLVWVMPRPNPRSELRWWTVAQRKRWRVFSKHDRGS